MTGVRKRQLDDLLRALGSDVTSDQAEIDRSTVQLGYDLGQLHYSLPNRTSTKCWIHLIPSAAAAQFSGIDLTPIRGMWVRKLTGFGGNMLVNVYYSPGQPAMAANDALAAQSINVTTPEGSDFPVLPAGLNGYALSDVTVPATVGAPTLFSAAQLGRYAGARSGMFLGANTLALEDMWIPPGASLEVSCGVANTVISVQFQLEFPTEVGFA
jgi:hypothetical protein